MVWKKKADIRGPRGAAGQNGRDGGRGFDGKDGLRGPQGLPGPDAIPAAEAVAGYVAGDSPLRTQLDNRYGASPVGYDIVILAGQSNMSGRGTPFSTITDPPRPRIMQYGNTGTAKNTISPASEPLLMHDYPSGIGPGLQFARWYASRRLDRNRKVLLVPVAHGGTPLSSTAALGWRRGVAGNLYDNMLTQARGALLAAGDTSTIVAALWLQGETDGDNRTTGPQYQADLDELIVGLRGDLNLPALPFIIGTMVPEYLGTGTRSQINAVHRDTPNRIPGTDVAVSAKDANLGDGNHFNAAGQRANGRAMWEAYERITAGLLPYSEAPSPIQVLGLSNAASAYSLRKVADASYLGKAVNVRRSSDSATMDIGFVGGALDTATLLTFAGSGDAFVVTWYDQSGNGREVTQATAAAQPKIVSAGALVTNGGKPAVSFDGVDDCLVNSSPVLFAAGVATVAQVLSAPTGTAQARVWTESTSTSSGDQYGLLQPDGTTTQTRAYPYPLMTNAFAAGTAGLTPTKSFFDGTVHQASAIDTGTSMSSWVDGAADVSGFTYTRTTSSKNRFTIGGVTRSGSLAPLGMKFSEFVSFARVLSSADRQSVDASQKAFYGTP